MLEPNVTVIVERSLATFFTKSNPEHFVVLPPKIFERELVTKGRDYFHNKIVVHDDLIVTFTGMSPKQREQLVNFWTMLLEGDYARDRNALPNVSVVALFGLASEQLDILISRQLSGVILGEPFGRHRRLWSSGSLSTA